MTKLNDKVRSERISSFYVITLSIKARMPGAIRPDKLALAVASYFKKRYIHIIYIKETRVGIISIDLIILNCVNNRRMKKKNKEKLISRNCEKTKHRKIKNKFETDRNQAATERNQFNIFLEKRM